MPTFKVYGNRVVSEHEGYFVRGASACTLGSYGRKGTNLVAKNGLDRDGSILEKFGTELPFIPAGPFNATFQSSFKLGHIGDMNLPLELINLNINDKTFYSMLIRGVCTFSIRRISPDVLKDFLNSKPRFREEMKDDNDMRFVTSVIWLDSCTISFDKDHRFKIDGEFSLNLDLIDSLGAEVEDVADAAPDGETKVKGKGSTRAPSLAPMVIKGQDGGILTRKLLFQYAPNTIMAYGLHKLEWDHKIKKKRERIEHLNPDWQGLN